MKHIYFIFFVFALLSLNIESEAQTIFNSDFDQTQWAKWQNIRDWRIDGSGKLEGNNCIQHNIYHRNGYSYLSHEVGGIHLPSQQITWEFILKNGDWLPTENERYGMFLWANQEELSTASGYAIGVNLTSSEGKLEICRMQNGIAAERLYLSPITLDISNGMKFKIERDNTSQWTLQFKDLSSSDWQHTIYFTSVEDEIYPVNYIGPFFQHNASHGGQFWIDNIHIESISLAPVVEMVRFVSPQSILLMFSQPMNKNSLQTLSNYQLIDSQEQNIEIDSIKVQNDRQSIVIQLLNELDAKHCTLTLGELIDADSLSLEKESRTLSLTYAIDPQLHDLIFTEIMYDAKGSTLLNGNEYIEIKNQRKYPLFLGHSYLKIGDQYHLLTDLILPENSFGVITKEENKTLNNDSVVKIVVPALQLRNSGNYLELRTNEFLNDSISYTKTLSEKSGFSAEKIDINRFCDLNNNWTSSIALEGGSPGLTNSVSRTNVDSEAPFIKDVELISETSALVYFSEKPVLTIEDIQSTTHTIRCKFVDSNSISIKWNNDLKFGQNLNFSIQNISDLCGNSDSIEYNLGNQNPQEGDLVLSEILFDPQLGSEEYIECANISEFPIDARNIHIEIRNNTTGDKKRYTPLSETIQIYPNQFIVFTKDSLAVSNNYTVKNPELLVQTQSIPALPNSGSTLFLLNKEQKKIDSLTYSPALHSVHLKETRGISLEKINLYTKRQTNNWMSANAKTASVAGTPTFSNNTQESNNKKKNWIVFENEELSPNGDGYHDSINFSIEMNTGDWLSTVKIYDVMGRVVCTLKNNSQFRLKQQLNWNGKTDNQKKLPIGNYIVVAQLTSEKGETKLIKQSIALTDRLR